MQQRQPQRPMNRGKTSHHSPEQTKFLDFLPTVPVTVMCVISSTRCMCLSTVHIKEYKNAVLLQ